jgi:hypothetical protein
MTQQGCPVKIVNMKKDVPGAKDSMGSTIQKNLLEAGC